MTATFGGLGVFVFGVPALGVALVAGVVGAIIRAQLVQIIACVVCLIIGALFYWSLPAARNDFKDLTLLAFSTSVGLGFFILGVSVVRRKTAKEHAMPFN